VAAGLLISCGGGATTAQNQDGAPIQGMKMTYTFSAKEVMIPFKCEVHGWMNAWIGVMDHPFYASPVLLSQASVDTTRVRI
jgi:hypothetical protein